jgi:uncharacterized membrane protein HdeD (DUF308 family)
MFVQLKDTNTMNTNKKILSMGIVLLIAGITAASMSFSPSRILQYIFVLTSLSVGIFGILIGKDTKGSVMRSTYYLWTGFVLIGLSIALVIWATSLVALVNVLGFFLLLFGFIEFVFALQILNSETPIPWKVVGLKLTLSATTAIGAASMLTMAGFHGYMALLVLGLLFVTVGLTFIQISRITKDTDSAVTN